jgi:hypothetical protein
MSNLFGLTFDRRRLFSIALILGVLLSAAAAPAAVDMTTGIRIVTDSGSMSDCGTKAKAALGTFLQNVTEGTPGSGEWLGTGALGSTGASTAGATIRCIALSKGYVATFTCAIVTGNPYHAADLCTRVADKFQGKTVTALPLPATPTPMPTGCATTNLVGTWASNDSSGPTFKMDVDGNLTDNDGVSGNWILDGKTVTLTYYGNHTLTLSADGKHLSGGGYNLTRKC